MQPNQPATTPATPTARYECRREVKDPCWTWVYRYEGERLTGVSAHPSTLPVGFMPFAHYTFCQDLQFLDLFRSIETECVEVPTA